MKVGGPCSEALSEGMLSGPVCFPVFFSPRNPLLPSKAQHPAVSPKVPVSAAWPLPSSSQLLGPQRHIVEPGNSLLFLHLLFEGHSSPPLVFFYFQRVPLVVKGETQRQHLDGRNGGCDSRWATCASTSGLLEATSTARDLPLMFALVQLAPIWQ